MFSGILATAHLVVVHLLSAAFGFEADAVMPSTTVAQPPHILLAVIDDLGWAEVGYHRAESTPEVQTRKRALFTLFTREARQNR